MQFNVLFAKSLLARISPQGLVCFVCVAMPAFAVVFDLHVAGTIHLSDQLLVVVKHDRLQHSPLSFFLAGLFAPLFALLSQLFAPAVCTLKAVCDGYRARRCSS